MKYANILLLLLPALLWAQEFQFRQEFDTIPVEIEGWMPFSPWMGGLYMSNPDFGDLDGDGDLDILVGSGYPIIYFENIGNLISPVFACSLAAIGNLATDGWSSPDLSDIDNDQDLDLFATSDERVWFFENIGTVQVPQFELITDSLEQITWWASNIDLADIDSDGDFDMFTGSGIGTIRFYRNTGTPDSFYFSPEEFQFEGIDVGDHSNPCFIDIDADNDYDFFIGNEAGRIWYYRNEGDSLNYNFIYVTNQYNGIDVGDKASPEFADIDGDGDYDLFVGRDASHGVINPGDIYFYENIGSPSEPQWQLITRNYLSLDAGDRAKLHTTDINADLDHDIFLGNSGSYISYYENTGTVNNAAFQWITDSYQNIHVTGCNQFFKDIDSDQDPDLFIGEVVIPNPPYPGLYLFENRGTPQNASFTQVSNNLVPGTYHVTIIPALADIDSDQDQDLFLSDNDGIYYFFENIGSPTSPQFAAPVLDWQGIHTHAANPSCFNDIDQDGDLDLFILPWDDYNEVWFYRNTGTPQLPDMTFETETFLEIEGQYTFEGIDIIDIDNDGDDDFLLGVIDGGGCLFFRNVTGEPPAVPPVVRHPQAGLQLSLGPNPANPVTWVTFNLPAPQKATLAVYNLLGQKVATLAHGLQPPGTHTYLWNASGFASGVYVVRLEVKENQQVGKVVVLR